MAIKIAVLKEHLAGERRVAMIPSLQARIAKLGARLSLRSGAGLEAGFSDTSYEAADIASSDAELLANAQVVLAVHAPSAEIVASMQPGSLLIGLLYLEQRPELLEQLCQQRITAYAVERIPRVSRAQAMDALSSQATLVGYLAPLLGALELPRILPMMTTAVGSLRAARVLVMGLGVAGLQALATARRLGAVTEGYDVRPETKEQAQSVGARFIETGVDARGEGGYARALTAEEQAATHAALTEHIAQADLIITTANVPGRAAPRLIDRSQIDRMKAGSVIVDLAAESGGNCEGTVPGQTVLVGPAKIVAPMDLISRLAQHASELYAKNLAAILDLVLVDGAVKLDFADELIAGAVVTHGGTIVSPPHGPAPAGTSSKEAYA
ncbi:NAD(P) transhydrogenase subunit alpha [Luteibacter yeojuensis]